jgi:hypothetical protein
VITYCSERCGKVTVDVIVESAFEEFGFEEIVSVSG